MPRKEVSKTFINPSRQKPLRTDYKPGTDVSIKGIKLAIAEALFENDLDTFQGCISFLLDKCKDKDITKKTGLLKSTLHNMCKPNSNPSLKKVTKVLSYIKHLDKKTDMSKKTTS